MKERPILFSAPMVRALLDGSKTQTRRVCKPAEAAGLSYVVGIQDPRDFGQRPLEVPGSGWFGDEEGDVQFRSPHGKPGDRLWVRESGVRSILLGRDTEPGLFRHDVPETPDVSRHWVESTRSVGASYNAVACTRQSALLSASAKVCPSIHMPRWASRILLEVVSVRVERLNDCSVADALAEGVTPIEDDPAYYGVDGKHLGLDPRESYAELWESINGAGSWAANPWVWVVEFKRVTP